MKRALSIFALTLFGCSSEAAPTGFGEPIRVLDGVFKSGPLPGTPAVDGGTPAKPNVTAVNSANNILRPGQGNKNLTGVVTDDASAVAVRFADLGTGYWLVVPGAPDVSAPDALQWGMNLDVAADVPPGLHTLQFAAVDEKGNAGTQTDLLVCVDTPIPDNLNACDPSIAPPTTVVSLTWDAAVDLDLVVVLPSGQVVDAKHRTTAPITDAGVQPNPKKDGVIDRDSNSGCAIDGIRRENMVWQAEPLAGQYLVYANLFSACGQQAVRFTVTLYRAQPVDGGSALVETAHESGELLAIDANGGATKGLYVTAFSLP
ncbi:Hypothetical protein A7982_09111 [Minicystis rosea]|nr:Hypothetical protein A7982_09111 [Minicystis rosea]